MKNSNVHSTHSLQHIVYAHCMFFCVSDTVFVYMNVLVELDEHCVVISRARECSIRPFNVKKVLGVLLLQI